MSYGSKYKQEVKLSFMVMMAITMTVPVFASLGLAVRFPDLVMEKVSLGTFLNLRKDKNVPYVLMNRTDGTVNISVIAERPGKVSLKEGYEPVPRPDWVKVVPENFVLQQGEAASADVILSVPNDPSLTGRHFQADIVAKTKGTGFLSAGVRHTVRFSVGILGPDSLKQEKALQILENLDMELTPQSLEVENFPLGRRVALKDMKAGPLKLTNRGSDPVRLRLDSVTVDNNLKRAGYDAADSSWLTIRPASLRARPNRIEDAQLFLQIPDVPENRGRKFMFVVRGELEGMQIPLAMHSRIYVTTEGDLRPQGERQEEPVKTE